MVETQFCFLFHWCCCLTSLQFALLHGCFLAYYKINARVKELISWMPSLQEVKPGHHLWVTLRYVLRETHLALLLELHPASIAKPLQWGGSQLDLISIEEGLAAKLHLPGSGFQILSYQAPSSYLFPSPYLSSIFIKSIYLEIDRFIEKEKLLYLGWGCSSVDRVLA